MMFLTIRALEIWPLAFSRSILLLTSYFQLMDSVPMPNGCKSWRRDKGLSLTIRLGWDTLFMSRTTFPESVWTVVPLKLGPAKQI